MNLIYFLKGGVTLIAAAAIAGSALANDVYIALGDSVAYGYQPTDSVPTDADRAYVKAIGDRIGELHGVRPDLINLALPTETSASFFDTSNIYRLANTNYVSDVSQAELFSSIRAARLGAGDRVTHISLALGANDLIDLITPEFLALDSAQQSAQIALTLQVVGANYDIVLSGIRSTLPHSQVLMPGFYNPFPTGMLLSEIGDLAVGALNDVISLKASQHNGTYVDFFSPMKGREREYTWIGDGDIHPNDAGYAVLGQAASARVQAVPEPGSLAVLGIGALALVRRRMAGAVPSVE